MRFHCCFLLFFLMFGMPQASAGCNVVHLHMNKVAFLPGEALAFKSYVYDIIEDKAVLQRRNLIVTMVNSDRDTIAQRKLAYHPMSGHDVISTEGLQPGNYFILATLESSNGAQCGYPFIQGIRILGEFTEEMEGPRTVQNYLELFPADGGLLSGVVNKLVYRVNISGKGQKVEVRLATIGGELITSSKPIHPGYGTLSFIPEHGTRYRLELYLNSKRIETESLLHDSKGALKFDVSKNTRQGKLSVAIQRADPLPGSEMDSVQIIIRSKSGISRHFLPLKSEKKRTGALFDLRDLPGGFSAIEMLDEQGNYLDRNIIFNEFNMRSGGLELQLNPRGADSLELEIFQDQNDAKRLMKSFSVSILPSFTEAVENRKTIHHSIVINPIRELRRVRDLFSYDPTCRSQNIGFDQVISSQTEGALHATLKNLWRSDITYTQGFRLNGFINKVPDHKRLKVLVQAPQRGLWAETELKPDNTFQFQHLEAVKGEPVSLLLADAKGRVLSKPVSFHYTLQDAGVSPRIQHRTLQQESYLHPENPTNLTSEVFFPNNRQIDLEEVVVTGSKLKYKEFVRGPYYGRKIDSTLKGYGNLETLIKSYGYNWSYIPPGPNSRPGRDGLVLVKIRASGSRLFPTVIYNGKYHRDPSRILGIPIEDLEEIYYNGGNSRSGGTFIVFGKEVVDASNATESIILETGFDRPSEYQPPLYAVYDHPVFHRYGQIAWSPNVIQQEGSGSAKLTFDGHGHGSFKVIIEGIDENGKTYYFEDTISNGAD